MKCIYSMALNVSYDLSTWLISNSNFDLVDRYISLPIGEFLFAKIEINGL